MSEKFDIFISYQWDIKKLVLKLYDIIYTNITRKIWLDYYQINSGTILFEELKKGIDNSKAIILCITMAYSESQNCQDEFSYALWTRKPVLFLFFERLDITKDIGFMGFKMVNHTRCNVYKNLDLFYVQSGYEYDDMMTSIWRLLDPSKSVNTERKPKSVDLTLKSINLQVDQEENEKRPYNINDQNFIFYHECSICHERDDCLRLWTIYYCEICWDQLGCFECKNKIEKSAAYRGDDNQILCKYCALKIRRSQSLVRSSRSRSSTRSVLELEENEPDDEIVLPTFRNNSFRSEIEILPEPFNISNIASSYEYKLRCCRCNEKGTRFRVWKHNYCLECWNFLRCKACRSKINKSRAYRSKKYDILCELCIRMDKPPIKYNIRNRSLNEFEPFDLNEIEFFSEHKKCHICGEKESGFKAFKRSYCNHCWTYLGCKKCDNLLDKRKAYCGLKDEIYCETCIYFDSTRKAGSEICVLL